MGAKAAPGMLWPSRGLGDRCSQPAGNLLTLGTNRDCQADKPGVPVSVMPGYSASQLMDGYASFLDAVS